MASSHRHSDNKRRESAASDTSAASHVVRGQLVVDGLSQGGVGGTLSQGGDGGAGVDSVTSTHITFNDAPSSSVVTEVEGATPPEEERGEVGHIVSSLHTQLKEAQLTHMHTR